VGDQQTKGMTAVRPNDDQYAGRTTRTIPVVVLERTA
jgi:hypothetical protein